MASLEKLRVLVVDDNAHMRAIVVTVLKSVGIKDICEVADGTAAFAAMEEFAPDVAIVDFRMAPMDGVTFTRKVRNDPESKNPFLPIILLTGYGDKPRILEARDAGVTEIIVKPVTANAVIARLNAVIFHPRPFVKNDIYLGPDRRRRKASDYEGPERRDRGGDADE
jgi:CheY-like chemotaxis protein